MSDTQRMIEQYLVGRLTRPELERMAEEMAAERKADLQEKYKAFAQELREGIAERESKAPATDEDLAWADAKILDALRHLLSKYESKIETSD